MSYEVTRDIDVERVEEAPNGVFREAPFTMGIEAARSMPQFTDEEIQLGLGEEYLKKIEHIFATAYRGLSS
jgi:hypothetical protein